MAEDSQENHAISRLAQKMVILGIKIDIFQYISFLLNALGSSKKRIFFKKKYAVHYLQDLQLESSSMFDILPVRHTI